MADTGSRPILEVRNIRKHFGGIEALRGVSFDLWEGEILAIVGDNGAGKSTLIKIISGVYQKDEGEIRFYGRKVNVRNPSEAKRLGIETVYQDLALVDELDIPANIFLGREATFLGRLGRMIGLLDYRKMAGESARLLRDLNIDIPNLFKRVRYLSGGQRQVVALSKVVFWGKKLVILDEPTAALGVKEAGNVLELIRRLRERGISVIIVSHNLQHVFRVVDKIMVLRRGENVGVRSAHQVTANDIVSMITGVEVVESV